MSRKRGNEESTLDASGSDFSSKRARNPDGHAVNTSAGRGYAGGDREKPPPSLVLHVRSLPTFTSEQELVALLAPFGPPANGADGSTGAVVRAFITQHNHQAFVQMASLEAAEAVVRHSSSPPGFAIRGRQIFLQYSTRKEVVPPPNQNASYVPGAPAAAGFGGFGADQQQSMGMLPMGGAGGMGGGGMGGGSGGPNSVILLSVTNLRVPVTLEHIHQICKASGPVSRIVTFMKGPVFKALVQFATVDAAVQARQSLEGKDIFANCCHVSVSFSSLQELKITTPGPKARDFEAEAAGGGAPVAVTAGAGQQGQAAFAQMAQQQQQQQQQAAVAQQAAMGYPMSAFGGNMMNPYAMQQQQVAAAAQQQNPYAHMASQMGFAGMPGFAGMAGMPGAAGMQGGFDQQQGQQQQQQGQQQQQQRGAGGVSGGPGCVLLVSCLPTTPDVTPESLFTLFGVYGDVIRVKILFAKRDTALIQFRDAAGCSQAIQHLHQAPLAGPDQKPLNVSLSKHGEISAPKAPADGTEVDQSAQLTQDFTGSKIHRFRGKPVNPKNVHSPSEVLHVANIPDGTSEEQLQQLFGSIHTQLVARPLHLHLPLPLPAPPCPSLLPHSALSSVSHLLLSSALPSVLSLCATFIALLVASLTSICDRNLPLPPPPVSPAPSLCPT